MIFDLSGSVIYRDMQNSGSEQIVYKKSVQPATHCTDVSIVPPEINVAQLHREPVQDRIHFHPGAPVAPYPS